MLDILFDDQVCSLVYMTDLAKEIEEGEHKQTQESLLKASSWICRELQAASQETILMLVGHLLENCTEENREALEGIQFGIKLLQLLLSNMVEF